MHKNGKHEKERRETLRISHTTRLQCPLRLMSVFQMKPCARRSLVMRCVWQDRRNHTTGGVSQDDRDLPPPSQTPVTAFLP